MKLRKYFSDRKNTFMPRNINSDVLTNSNSKLLRKHDLKRAVILGTVYNQETNLEFVDHTGRNQMLITKVIGLSDENAFLLNNRIIPIRKISRVVV